MDELKKVTGEPFIYFITGIILAFITVVFSDDVADKIQRLYVPLILIDVSLYLMGANRIRMNGIGKNTITAIITAIVGVAALTVSYGLVNATFRAPIDGAIASDSVFQSVYQTMQSQLELKFEQMPIFYWLTFGFLIPIVETRLFFGRFIDFGSTVFGISLSRMSGKLIALMTIASAVFTYFHLKVRGIDNNVGLGITFIFGFASCLFIYYSQKGEQKEIESATWFHIFWNSAAIFIRP